MSDVAFTRMMDSGVLRPGDREIRRGPGGIPLYATRQVSDLLNHSLDVLFGSELESDQQKTPKMVLLPKPDKLTPSQPNRSRFSLKAMLIWLGLLDQTNGGARPESPSPEILVPRLKARIQKLESLLKAERVLCQAQREELSKLRVQANRNDILEKDLAIERESGAQLVHWLQEAEQELANLRRSFCGVGK
ncbi:MAG TPA: hypothetical protein VNI35_04275 [Nitrospira sp.]|nr:hypothetical protein [Nitrospira sp.]